MDNLNSQKQTIGILAHVDAGKTTLSEAVLFLSGSLRKAGRVDHGDTFLDNDVQERERGITIFSKQAEFRWKNHSFTLLDTPGHVDFSGETERALSVLDAAILVINGSDGVQSHTRTLWRLLDRYEVPVFIFFNKMDQTGADAEKLLAEVKQRLSPNCFDFTGSDWLEEAASESEKAMEEFLETENLSEATLSGLVAERKIFPCFYGSALKMQGIEDLLNGLCIYLPQRNYPEDFSANIYKITRDRDGTRLAWAKITGGKLNVKETLSGRRDDGSLWSEKVNQIRIYSGGRYELIDSAAAGTVCALTGLLTPKAGEGLGASREIHPPYLEPVFSYRVDCGTNDIHTVLMKLRELEEEDPQLHVVFRQELNEIRVQLMGEIQLEILERLIKDRYKLDVHFSEGGILYRETIREKVEGIGHYEPLRHYAEVHLLLEPGERGSGLRFNSACSTDQLSLNWQRLILTHLAEKTHAGVLTGSPITDIKITLTAGRAHEKHTEGGDFRQATYRAVRQGLMSADSILLEPWYDIRLELPAACVGRALTDLQRMGGSFDPPESCGEESVITGLAPVAEMRNYQRELASYTRGLGRLFCTLHGYEPCRNAAEVIAASDYDAERDILNPADSVFCSHGAGFTVKWDQVSQYMHLDSTLDLHDSAASPISPLHRSPGPIGGVSDEELKAIYERTYGKIKERPLQQGDKRPHAPSAVTSLKAKPIPKGPEYLLVDGYNIIFAWDEFKNIASDHLDAARQQLMDLMCNYQGIRDCKLILVFDAYRVPFHKEEILSYNNIYVVFTREAETADAYIEKTSRDMAKEHRVRVATSDSLEQLIILGQGALRVSADAFHAEVSAAGEEIRKTLRNLNRHMPSGALAEAWKKAENKSSQ